MRDPKEDKLIERMQDLSSTLQGVSKQLDTLVTIAETQMNDAANVSFVLHSIDKSLGELVRAQHYRITGEYGGVSTLLEQDDPDHETNRMYDCQ